MTKETRIKQLNVRVGIAVLAIGIVIGHISSKIEIDPVQECSWTACDCFKRYDSFGVYHNDNHYMYHCTVHGDGHDCY